ncbi:MAG: hypothetical protein AB7P08_17825 [Burkholderiales bacterium]
MNADITPMNADKAMNDSGSFERGAMAQLSSVGPVIELSTRKSRERR